MPKFSLVKQKAPNFSSYPMLKQSPPFRQHSSIHRELADMDCCGNGNRKLLTSIIIQVDALQWVGFLLLGLTFVVDFRESLVYHGRV